jgi:hypothetical protein
MTAKDPMTSITIRIVRKSKRGGEKKTKNDHAYA